MILLSSFTSMGRENMHRSTVSVLPRCSVFVVFCFWRMASNIELGCSIVRERDSFNANHDSLPTSWMPRWAKESEVERWTPATTTTTAHEVTTSATATRNTIRRSAQLLPDAQHGDIQETSSSFAAVRRKGSSQSSFSGVERPPSLRLSSAAERPPSLQSERVRVHANRMEQSMLLTPHGITQWGYSKVIPLVEIESPRSSPNEL